MKRLISAGLFALLLTSCVDEQLETPVVDSATDTISEGAIMSGECIVLFSEDVTAQIEESQELGLIQTKSAGIDDMLEQLGVTSMKRLFPYAGEYEPRTRREGLHRWYVLTYSESVPFTKADAGLGCLLGVEFVEPVRKIKIQDYNDPYYPNLWGLNNVSYSGYDINVKPVWKDYTTGSPDVIVSVVDNGVQLDHPDLRSNCVQEHYNAVDNTSIIYAGDHGTHVAGTIAAVGNNGKGIVGVAGGDYAAGRPGVKIMSCQIFKDTPEGTASSQTASAAAIKWGADNGAVISQNSWGYEFDDNGDGKLTGKELELALASTISKSDKDAIDYFIKYAGCDNYGNQLSSSPMKGGVVIFAAGNDNIENGAPAEYDEVIAVGSIASNGLKSSFSNYGDWVDLAAPGSDIYSTVTGSGYAYMNGTSMACPHVSGVAALVVSYCGGPGFTNDMLKEKLLNGANPTAIPASYRIGALVDALGAVTYGTDKAPAQVTDLSAGARANTMDLSFTATADEDGKPAYGYMALYSTDRSKVEAATHSDYKDVDYALCTPDSAVGEKVNFTIKGLDFNSTYYVKILSFSYGRNYAEASEIIEFETGSNNAPSIELVNNGSYSIKPSQNLEVTINVVDPDGHSVEVTLDCEAEHTFVPALEKDVYNFKVVGKDVEPGRYEAKIVAADEYGMATVETVSFEVLDNAAPVILKEIDDILMSAKGKEFVIDMKEYVNDPDGEQLKYKITVSNEKVVNITPRGDKLYVTALAFGLADVSIVASDIRNQKVEFGFKVLVKNSSDPLSLYPDPVTDYLNVGTMEMAETDIQIYSSTGKLFYEATAEVSGTEPARIDMRAYPPGTYSVKVVFGGKEYKKNVVKL